jgi:cytochrome d ubiquinol oxidase subunit II
VTPFAALRPGRARRLRAARRDLAGDEDRGAAVAERARRQAKGLIVAVIAFMAAVSLWTPLGFERIAQRWFATPNIFFLWPVPLVTALVAFAGWRAIERGREASPFFAAIGLFLLGYLGLVISMFPYLVPPTLTVWQTAAVPASQIFMLIGTLLLLPVILGYVGFVHLRQGARGRNYH